MTLTATILCMAAFAAIMALTARMDRGARKGRRR